MLYSRALLLAFVFAGVSFGAAVGPNPARAAGSPDGIGVYSNGFWLLDKTGDGLFTAGADVGLGLGWPGAVTVVGDWDGDGLDSAGVYAGGFWFLDYDGDGAFNPAVDKQFPFGWQGAAPVVGDWDGDGRTDVGVFFQGSWFLDSNGNRLWDAPGSPGGDSAFSFGVNGAAPYVGDWNGDGRDKVAFYADGFWFYDMDGNQVWDGGVVDRQLSLGWPGATPVVGDWNGDGKDESGVFALGFWFLDYDGNRVWDGGAADRAFPFGWNGARPVLGDWNGDGSTDVGVFHAGYWFLDANGNALWDGVNGDRIYGFGQASDTPVVGRWGGAAPLQPLRLYPPNGAQAYPPDQRLIVEVPSGVDPSSVTAQTVKLLRGGGGDAPATRVVSADGRYISVRPDGAMAAQTEYILRVSGLRAAAGAAIPGVQESRFVTSSSYNGSYLNASSGQANAPVPTNAQIQLAFSPPLDPASWSRDALSLRHEGPQTLVPLDCELSADWTSALCVAPGGLPVGARVTVLGPGVQGLNGGERGSGLASLVIGFEPDLTPPQLTQLTPHTGAAGFPLSGELFIRTSERTVPDWPGTEIELRRNGVVVPVFVAVDSYQDDALRVYPPGDAFQPSSTYALTVRKLFDAAGNAFSGSVSTTFTTAPSGSQPGHNVSLWPASQYRSTLPTNAAVHLSFEQPLFAATVSSQTVWFESLSGEIYPTIVSLVGANDISLRPQADLPPQMELNVRISEVEDQTGYEYDLQWRVATAAEADRSPPAVVGVSPPNGATAVTTKPKIEVRLTEPVFQPTGGEGSVRVLSQAGALAGTILGDGYDTQSKAFTLLANTQYRVIVEGYVDAVGQPIARYEATFQTGVSATPANPIVVSSSPVNGAIDVPLSPVITMNLSDPLNPLTVNEESVILRDGSVDTPSTVQLLNGNRTVVVTPRTPLLPNRPYTVVGSVLSYAGLGLTVFSGPQTMIGFRTGAGPADTIPPQVLSMTPADGAVLSGSEVSQRISLGFNFSEPIEPSSFSQNSLFVSAGGQRLNMQGPFTSSDGRYATATAIWPGSTQYPQRPEYVNALITTEVADLSGNALPAEFVGRFRVLWEQPDSSGPFEIFETLPSYGSEAPPGTPITWLFSRAVDAAGLDRSLYVSRNGALVDGVFEALGENRVVRFTPAVAFAAGDYVEVFPRDGFRAEGNPDLTFQSSLRNYFSIAEAPDAGPPVVEQHGVPFQLQGVVPPNVVLTARISEPLAPATVNASSVILTKSQSQAQPTGSISLSADRTVVEYRPSQPLTPGGYFLSFQTTIKDASGEPLAYTYSFSFTVEGAADATPPAVLAVSPPPGAGDVPMNAQIRVRFSEQMNAPTIRNSTFQLRKNGLPVPVTEVMVEDRGEVFSFRPITPLDAASVYTVTLLGAYDAAGNLAPQQQWSFTTGATIDTEEPALAFSLPYASQVGTAAVLRLPFDERLDPTAPNPYDSGVREGSNGPFVSASIAQADQGHTLTFTPAQPLKVGTSYDLVVSSARDLAGNSTYVRQSFQTGFAQADPPPSIISSTPAAGATSVDPFAPIEIGFSEAIDPATLTASNVRLLDGATVLPSTLQLSLNGSNTVRIFPSDPLPLGRTLTLDVRIVEDWLGTPMSAPFVVPFTTLASLDTTNPTYFWNLSDLGSYVNQGGAGVFRNIRAKVTFSERINPATVRADTIYYVANGSPWPSVVQLDSGGRLVTLAPATPLPAGAEVTLGVTSAVTDLAGNPAETTGSVGVFRTGQEIDDTTPPHAISVLPPNGATGVLISTTPHLVLNEPLDPEFPMRGRLLDPQGADVLLKTTYPRLQPSTAYHFVADNGRDYAGNLMTPWSSTFTTGPTTALDSTKPLAIASNPAPESVGASVTPTITVDFDEPVVLYYAAMQAEVSGYPQAPIRFFMSPDGLRLTVVPRDPLLVNTRYDVSFLASDLAGNKVNPNAPIGDYFRFTTGTGSTTTDTTPPQVLSINPPDGATGVTDRTITLAFSEPIHPGTVQNVQVFLDGLRLSLSIGRVGDGSTLTADLNSVTADGGAVSVYVPGLVTDLAGNPAQAFLSRFDVAPRPANSPPDPLLQSVRPASGSAGVAADAEIHMIFTQPLAPGSIAGSVIVSENGAPIPGALSLSAGNQVMTYTPDRPYAAGATIELFLDLTQLQAGSGGAMGTYVSSARNSSWRAGPLPIPICESCGARP